MRVNDASGFVARHLFGRHSALKGARDETYEAAKGDTEDEIRRSVFRLERWTLTQAAAEQLLGMCERSFRRYLGRYEAEGLEGLIDQPNRWRATKQDASLTRNYSPTQQLTFSELQWRIDLDI